MSNPVIKFTDFYYGYLNSDLILKDINLTIEQGSFTVIAGPSGAGKTTMCKLWQVSFLLITAVDMPGRRGLGEDVKGKKVSDLAMRVGIMLDDYESQLVSLTAGG